MAKSYVKYVYEDTNTDEKDDLCFKCAVRNACRSRSIPKSVRIYQESTDYEFSKCSECGEYIKDTVEV